MHDNLLIISWNSLFFLFFQVKCIKRTVSPHPPTSLTVGFNCYYERTLNTNGSVSCCLAHEIYRLLLSVPLIVNFNGNLQKRQETRPALFFYTFRPEWAPMVAVLCQASKLVTVSTTTLLSKASPQGYKPSLIRGVGDTIIFHIDF